MNLDLDLSAVSRFFRGILTELRQKRLWPVVAVLLVAAVAAPFVLSKSATPAPQPQAQVPTPPPASATSLPTLNVETTPSTTHPIGPSHNPFGTGSGTATTTTSSPVSHAAIPSTGTTPSTSPGTTVTGTGGSPTTTSNASSGTAPSSTPPSITGNAKPKPAPSGLKPTQAYDVALTITTSNGGINTIDPLQRLSLIPSDQQPMLIELGVSRDGNHVLFAVQPNAIPTGPGVCTPGVIDCEILSLGQDQTEELSTNNGSLGPAQVALFAITSISATDYQSSAAADNARRATSSAGRTLLDQTKSPTLSLFQYEPSLGTVVDLRNLKVGGTDAP